MSGFELRDKDKALANACESVSAAARDAVGWVQANGDVVHSQQDALLRSMRQTAVDMGKLADAAGRPMAVGVFGVSQAGKSTMIGKLVAPSENPAYAVFGEGAEQRKMDFGLEVNPQGGNETTGVVTRLTIRKKETPAGFPVPLRLFREVDIVKILANTFLGEVRGDYCKATRAEPDVEIHTEPTIASIEAMEARLGVAGGPDQSGMALVEIYELRKYLEDRLDLHLLAKKSELADAYWRFLETHLPKMTAEQRAEALDPLWGGYEEFRGRYLQMKAAIDRLGHAVEAFAPIASIEDPQKSIAHAEQVITLDRDGPAEKIQLMANGAAVELDKRVATAIISELWVTLDRAPWPFFNTIDLLDFPGARSREQKPADEYLRDPTNPEASAICYLRGKVALLFDNYTDDLDLNAMIICVGNVQDEVKTLPTLVDGWLKRTHGAYEERARAKLALFVVQTKYDISLNLRSGDSFDYVVAARFEKVLRPFKRWMTEWAPGQTFQNVFMTRDPDWPDATLFTYHGHRGGDPDKPQLEVGYASDFAAKIDELRATFLANAEVKAHVDDAPGKFDNLLALNDGGLSYLAGKLAPACDLDLKYSQILPKAQAACASMQAELQRFYEDDDIEKRVKTRLQKILPVLNAFQSDREKVPLFLSEFFLSPEAAARCFLEHSRQASVSSAGVAATTDDEPLDWGIEPAADADENAPADAVAPAAPGTFGAALMARWAELLERKAADAHTARFFGADESALRTFVGELIGVADRRGVSRQLDALVPQGAHKPEDRAADIGARSASLINGEILYLGHRDQAGRFTRPAETPAGALPNLVRDPAERTKERRAFMNDWLFSLRDATEQNARIGEGGGQVDPVQNRRLGTILSTVVSAEGAIRG